MSLCSYSVLFVLLVSVSGSLFGQGVSDVSIPSFETISNEVVVLGKSDLKQREIYVLLLTRSPTKDSIERLFDSIQREYCSPYALRVVAYSDKEMLLKQIRLAKAPFIIDFNDSDPSPRTAQEYYESVYPKPAGYFRARYFRYADFEFFDYSPKIDVAEMERVDLANGGSSNRRAASPCNEKKPQSG